MHSPDVSRGYQLGYYQRTEGLRDLDLRRAKARKIMHCLAETKLPEPVGVALDVGCSNGLVLEALEPVARCVAGLDIDGPALYASPSFGSPKIALLQGDAMAFPFRSGTIDLIVCAQVYEHVPDDTQLVAEMWRVLRAGGVIFFSGPNFLFPIEPHYGLPFLHWLPRRAADALVRAIGKGPRYYERSRTTTGLRRLLREFVVRDLTPEVMRYEWAQRQGIAASVLRLVPKWFWQLTSPLAPNMNWILQKPETVPEEV